MEVTANVGQQPYPMETGKKISKIDVVIMRRGTLGDTQYRNTVTINGKYQNTTWKIVQIPIPHILITFIIGSTYLWLLPSCTFNYPRPLCTRCPCFCCCCCFFLLFFFNILVLCKFFANFHRKINYIRLTFW